MKISELNPTKIILETLGERSTLKDEEELLNVFKARFTKKERAVLKEKFSGVSDAEIMATLNFDEKRLEEVFAGAIKKIKNQAIHREFYK